jgi:hypothetical protein
MLSLVLLVFMVVLLMFMFVLSWALGVRGHASLSSISGLSRCSHGLYWCS